MEKEIFRNKKFNFNKLLSFGFVRKSGVYNYTKDILDGEFELTVTIFETGKIRTEIIEKSTGEIYTLHLVEEAEGTFVGKVREEYENVLSEIAQKCCDTEIFKSLYAKKIIEHVRKKYNDELEYLWEKFPDNAIARRKDNKKWYLAILTVKKSKLGFETEEAVEIIDLRAKIEDISALLATKNIYPGYHMNKKHWITIILDGSVCLEKIFEYIEDSYNLAKK